MAEREIVITEKDYPSNSHIQKRSEASTLNRKLERKNEKKVKTIAQAKKVKKPVGKRIVEEMTGDDTESVLSYILYDVLIPAAKNTISEMVSGGIQMLLFGESNKDSRIVKDRGRSYVSYQKYYDRDDREDRRASRDRRGRSRYEFDDIAFDSRAEAEEVLSYLIDCLEDYDVVSVSDFYDIVGMTSEYTDAKWGWYNLSRAAVVRSRRGHYYIQLPHPMALD